MAKETNCKRVRRPEQVFVLFKRKKPGTWGSMLGPVQKEWTQRYGETCYCTRSTKYPFSSM